MSQYSSKRQDATKIYESNRSKIPLGATDKLTAKFSNQEIPSKEQVSSDSKGSSFSAGRWSSSRKNETTETEAESLLKSKPSCIPSSGREVNQSSYGWSSSHSHTTSDRTSDKIDLGENYHQRNSPLTHGKMSNVPSYKHKGMAESSTKEDSIQDLKVGRFSGPSCNIPLRATVHKSHDSDKNSDYGINKSSLHDSVSLRKSPTKSSEPSNSIKKTPRIFAKERLSGHHNLEMAKTESSVSPAGLDVNENNNDLKSLRKTFTPARAAEGSANQSFDRSDLKYNSCRSRIPTPNSPSSSHKTESPLTHKLSSQSFSFSRGSDSNSEINSEPGGMETNESRAERIARYKQIRRHELAAKIRAKLDANAAEKNEADKRLGLKQNLNPEIAKEKEPLRPTPSLTEKVNLNLRTEKTEPDLKLDKFQLKSKNVAERSKKRQERMLRNSQHLSADLIGQNAKSRILTNKLDTSPSVDSRNIPPSIADDTQPSLTAERAMSPSEDDRSLLAQPKSEEVGTNFTSNISNISSDIPSNKNLSNQLSKLIGAKSETEADKSSLSLSNESFIDKANTKDLHTPLRKENVQEAPNIDTQQAQCMPQKKYDEYLTSGSETGFSDYILNYCRYGSDNYRNSNIDSESDVQIYSQASDLNENPRSSTSFVKSKPLPASTVSYTKQLLKDLNVKSENQKAENEYKKDIDWLERRKYEYLIKKAEKDKKFSVIDTIKAAEIKANAIRQIRERKKANKPLERTMSDNQVRPPLEVYQETKDSKEVKETRVKKTNEAKEINKVNEVKETKPKYTNLERAKSFGSIPFNNIEEFLLSPKYESNLDELLLKNAAYLADEETDLPSQSVRNLHPKENLKLRKSIRKKKLTKLASVTEKNNHVPENLEKETAVTPENRDKVSQLESYYITKESQDKDQENSSLRTTSSSERTLGANSPRYINSDFSSDTDKAQECYSYQKTLANKANTQLERRRFRTRDKDISKRSNLQDSVSDFSEDTSSSAQTLSDARRVHRKRDKSSCRKSYLNISEDSEEKDQSENLSVSDASTSNRTVSQSSDVKEMTSQNAYYKAHNLPDSSTAGLEGKRVRSVTTSESEREFTSESERLHCNERPKIPFFTKVPSTSSNAMDYQQSNIFSISNELPKNDVTTDHVQPPVYASKNVVKLSNTATTTRSLHSGGLSIKSKSTPANKHENVDSTSKLVSRDARSDLTAHHTKEKLEKTNTDDTAKAVATKVAHKTSVTTKNTDGLKSVHAASKSTEAIGASKIAPAAAKTPNAIVTSKTAPTVTKTTSATVAPKTTSTTVVPQSTTTSVAPKTTSTSGAPKAALATRKNTETTLAPKTTPTVTKATDTTATSKKSPITTKATDAIVAPKTVPVATVASKAVTNTSDVQAAPTTTIISNTTLTLQTSPTASNTINALVGPKLATAATKTTCAETSSTIAPPQVSLPTTKSSDNTIAPQTLPTATKITTKDSKTAPVATEIKDSRVASQIPSTVTTNTDLQLAQKDSYTATAPTTTSITKTTDSKTTFSETKSTDSTATSKVTPIATKTLDTTSLRITQTMTKATDSVASLEAVPAVTTVTDAPAVVASKIMPAAITSAITKTTAVTLTSPETKVPPKVTPPVSKTTDTTVTVDSTSSIEKTTDSVGGAPKLPTAGKKIDTSVVTTVDPNITTKQILSEPKTVTSDSITRPSITIPAAKIPTATVTPTSVSLAPRSTVVPSSKIITTAAKTTDTITTTAKAPISKTAETVTLTKPVIIPTETLSTAITDTVAPLTKPSSSTGIDKSVKRIQDTDLSAVSVETAGTVEKAKAVATESKAKETTKEIHKAGTVETSSKVKGTDNINTDGTKSIKSVSTAANIDSTTKHLETSTVNSDVTKNTSSRAPTSTAANLDKTNISSKAQTVSLSQTINTSLPTQTSATSVKTLESKTTTKSIDTTDTKVLSSDTKPDVTSYKIHDTKMSNVESTAKSDTNDVGLTRDPRKVVDVKKTSLTTSGITEKSSDISNVTSTLIASSILGASTKSLEDNEEKKAEISKLSTLDTVPPQLYKHRRSEGSINTPHLSIHRGILKRTSSLHKQNSCSEEMDLELAKVFHSRRSKEDTEENSSDEYAPVFDEYQFRGQDSLQSDVINEEPEERTLSVSERICQMETQILSTSGAGTPKTPRSRLGSVTRTFNEDSQKSTLTEELFSKLSHLAHSKEAYEERRKRYQRGRDDWRSRTQPVTQEEVKQADSLETVSNFRALVMKRSSINIFEQLKEQEKQRKTFPGKKTEYPQPYVPEKKNDKKRERYKTLPVTAAELMDIPEGETVGLDNFKSTMQALRDYKTDSGIVSSCSDFERDSQGSDSMKNLAIDVEMEDDDITHLSVAARACIFQKLEEKSKKCASGAKRYIDRKKRERCKTQPVTEDEVKTASEIADERVSDRKRNSISNQIEYMENSQEAEKTPQTGQKISLTAAPSLESLLLSETNEEEMDLATHSDDLTRQSLADKVKLFSSPKTLSEKAVRCDAPVIRRRNRKVASRFNTQPVTSEEMESVFRISPLAMSLVKPPDPEILKGLPVNAQRDLIAQHAEACLSQQGSRPNSRPGSQAGSRRGSLEEHEQSKLETNEILKMADIESNLDNRNNIQAVDSIKHFDKEIKSTAKIGLSRSNTEIESKSVLKSKETKYQESHKLSTKSSDIGIVQTTTVAQIKTKEHKSMLIKEQNGEPRGILKKDSSFESKTEDTILNNFTHEPSLGNLNKENSTPDLSSYKKHSTSTRAVSRSLSFEDTKANELLNSSERSDSQVEIPTDKTPRSTPRKQQHYTSRQHLTEPLTSFEKKEASDGVETVVKLSGSVAERDNSPQMSGDDLGSPANRLVALKNSGEHDWKKRVYKQGSPSPSPDRELFKARSPSPLSTPVRPINLSERMSQLKSSQTSWKTRVEESDAQLFTVAGKLSKSGCVVREKTVLSQLKQRSFTESDDSTGVTSPTSPTKTEWKIPKPTEIISSDKHIDIEENEKSASSVVLLPDMTSEGLDQFFGCSTNVLDTSETLELNIDDFDAIFQDSQNLLMHNVKARPKKNVQARSKNPLKSRSVNLEKKEYQEFRTNIAEMEMKRIKKEIISKDAGFAEAALAGLASKENFSKIELRKTDISNPSPGSNRYLPYKPLMLFQIKGRRHVQSRLVEPCAKSVNHGDCYVLVTPDKIINWAGEFSNVIEKAKSADIAAHVQQKRDLGYRSTAPYVVTDSKKSSNPVFWDLLQGSPDDCQECGLPEEDELYENAIISTNMIYKIEKNSLKPYEEYWGDSPKHEMLKNNEVLVFDFGCELYVWQGKKASPLKKKLGLELAQQLWNKGYNYESSRINPISPLRLSSERDTNNVGCNRPSWAIFGKVNENMETIVFREKFADWPDSTRLIKVKSQETNLTKQTDNSDLVAYDGKKLAERLFPGPVLLVLEGSNVGRGTHWKEDMDGFIQNFEITTIAVTVWHILEFDHYKLDPISNGQFHDGDTYVVRWEYRIVATGAKTGARRTTVGRERCAYFFWQGKNSTITEKGASALMTVELDEERGPQVRVLEGKEPPCFLSLFGGKMIVHIGKREEEETNTQEPWKFFCLRNGKSNEICLIEIECGNTSDLRSRSSFILLNVQTGKVFIWHGSKSSPISRELAQEAVANIQKCNPLEVGLPANITLNVTQFDEGSETSEFWTILSGNDRRQYMSLLNDHTFTYEWSIRLFEFTSVPGVIEVTEVKNPSCMENLYTPYPYLQSDLYNVTTQPALFLLDNNYEVFVWQGWWPQGDEDIENVITGSAQSRFVVEKRCILQTALDYCKAKETTTPIKAYLVFAGLEPIKFTNLFPFWNVDEEVQELSLKDGKSENSLVDVREELTRLSLMQYPLKELLERPLPIEVDPLRLETYLCEEEFEEIFNMTQAEYYALPLWKQSKLKQDIGLF